MKKGFISIFLLAVMVGLLIISAYYTEMLSVKKRNLLMQKDSLVKEVEEFNNLQ
ncbi:MAG: hypothetical protein PHF25_03920 [Candidatus Margulisbacteria bacterium]|nr:hypothetical protein [Candidatus Margulisiibacteriota bacterium]